MSLARATVFYLWFNDCEMRWQLHDYGLHCGDGFEALIDGQWVQTRIEHHSNPPDHSKGWYLVTHPDQPLRDLPVRRRNA